MNQQTYLKTSSDLLREYFTDLKTEIDLTYARKIAELNSNQALKEQISLNWNIVAERIDAYELECLKAHQNYSYCDELLKKSHALHELVEANRSNQSFYSNYLNQLNYTVYSLKKRLFCRKTVIFVKYPERLDILQADDYQVGVLLIINGDCFTQEELRDPQISSCSDEVHFLMLDHLRRKLFTLSSISNCIYEIVFDKFHHEFMSPIRKLSSSISVLDQEYLLGFTNLKSIVYTDYTCTHIEAGTFDGLVQLSELSLPLNCLSSLSSSMFSSLINLTKLDLSKNKLKSLDKNLLAKLERLEVLNLSKNYLAHLDIETFQNCANLKVLNLATNCLSSLDKNLFKRLNFLEDLDLSDNSLVSFEPSLDCPSLKCLNLADNYLRSINEDSFRGLISLTWLNLSGNVLKGINENTFRNCVKLNHLNLAMNKLKLIDLNFVSKWNLVLFDYEFAKHGKMKLFERNKKLKSIIMINSSQMGKAFEVVENHKPKSSKCSIL